jgi:hypothetical protein
MRNAIYYGFLLIFAFFCALAPAPVLADGGAGDSVGPGFEVGGDVVLGPAAEYQIDAAVAFDGTNYLVVWSDYRSKSSYDILGARVAADGTIIDEGGFMVSGAEEYQEAPAVAFDGANYLVVWTDERNGSNDIYGARVDTAGTVLDPEGIPLCTEAGAQAEVAIDFGDSNYFLVWTDTRDVNENIYGTRVATDGTVLDAGGAAICTDPASQRYASVSRNGAGWLVVWQDRRNTQLDIYASRVSADGAVLDTGGIAIAATPSDETYPDLAYNGIECLVVWDVDNGATSRDIYGTRVDTAGTLLDSAGVAICDHPAYQGYPVASTYGSNYFVIWDDYRNVSTWDIYGARVDSAGDVIDTTSLAICLDPSQQFGLAAAFDGSNWLIAWHDSRNDHKDIFGIRVASGGTVVDASSFLVGTASVDQAEPAMAFDGYNYFIVWHEWREGSLYDIRGMRVSPDGTVLDPAGIAISAHSSDAMYPAVCFDGNNYLVAWQDYRSGQTDIYASRVTTGGTVLNPSGIPVSTASDRQELPAIAFNGTRYFVAWQDRRSGGFDLYGARMAPSGVVLDPSGILISDALRDQARPAAASDGQDFFVVWEDARNVYDDIFGARIDNDGTVLDTLGIAVASASLAQENADVVFDGDRYAVVWQDKRAGGNYNIHLARVTPDGAVLDPSSVLVSGAPGDQEAPSVAFNGRQYITIWQDPRGTAGLDIYGARVDTSGALSDPDGFEVSGAPHHQMAPDICSTPVGLVLMTYSSFISDPGYGSYRIWANFFDVAAGVPGGEENAGFASLDPGFPNPFRDRATFRFLLKERAEVALRVYDVEGRLVATLAEGVKGPGVHYVTWEPGLYGGRAPAAGIYFVSLKAGAHLAGRKVLLLR